MEWAVLALGKLELSDRSGRTDPHCRRRSPIPFNTTAGKPGRGALVAMDSAKRISGPVDGCAPGGLFAEQICFVPRSFSRRATLVTADVTPLNGEKVPDSDAMLVERTVAGDQKAFELLVIKYQRRIQRLIGRMVRDVDLVEDIAQETFIRAYRALAQFRGDAQFYTWLYRIAVNTAKKALMDLKRNPTISENFFKSGDDDETSPLENELISSETPDAVLASKEIAEMVNAAMEALPEELRQAITLREIEGLSYEEISEAMSCPIGTVRSRIFRAREAISERVKPLLENQSGKRW